MQRQTVPSHYNRTLARDRVEVLCAQRVKVDDCDGIPLACELVLPDFCIVEEKQPRFYKIITASDKKQCTFRIAGVLSFMDFPLTKPLPVNDRLRHRSQVAALTGFGAPKFENAINKLREVFVRFRRGMADGALQPLQITNRNGENELVFKCRYFTVGADADRTQNVSIPPAADYKGVISRMIQKKGVRYGEGNRVEYRKVSPSLDGEKAEYKPHSPISFRAGDIVEIEFTLVGIPLADGEVKCLLVQQSVTLLDDTLSLEAEIAEEEGRIPPAGDVELLKRKGAFEDEENDIRATRHAVAHMTLNESVAKRMDTRP